MHEVAVPSSGTGVLFILTTCGLPEISDRREFNHDGPSSIETPLQTGQRLGCTLLIPEFHVHAANHVICQVVADIQILDLTMLGQLLKNVFIEILAT